MAGKKKGAKKKPHHTKKRGHVGAISKETEDLLMLFGGTLLGKWLGNLAASKGIPALTSAFSGISPAYINYGVGAVEGGAGLFFALKEKNPIVKGVALGVALNGAEVIEKQLGFISGVGYISYPPMVRGVDPSIYRPTPRIGNPTISTFRPPATVGGVIGNRVNMAAIYAAGMQ